MAEISSKLALAHTQSLSTLEDIDALRLMDRRGSLHAEQLADKASQIETVVDNLKEGVILTDMHGNRLRRNQMASTLLGARDGPTCPESAAQEFDVCRPTGESFLGRSCPTSWP